MDLVNAIKNVLVPRELEEQVDRSPKSTGSFNYDAWGYNPDTAKISLALFKQLYDHYFRVEARGLEHVPKQGRALIIANHSGQLPMDGILIGVAMATNPDGPRMARAMVERFFPTVPFVGNLLNQAGAVIGDPQNCRRMLQSEEAVIVFPEGIRGSGKLYKDRYQLQRFGNGFMHIAMATETPIIPVGVVGCEETMPAIANIKPLAELLAIPYFPLAIPAFLPAKVILNFGEPMMFDQSVESEEAVTARVEQVKDVIRGLIEKGLQERERVFL
ncbi:lysophospholipid acyltransferase family protein [Sulfidibacter corallicola]|uniref:lysophospholipid acyltransferase family protein n=1 Tax=Sulfidibacter corallicola TaxID=2818388 RepID=UPI003B2274AE